MLLQGDFDSSVLRLSYSSLTTPTSVIDYNCATKARAVKKVQPVLGGFDKDRYLSERIWATAPDGVEVGNSNAVMRWWPAVYIEHVANLPHTSHHHAYMVLLKLSC